MACCKKLRDEGLHTFKDIVGYCMKDNGEDRFKFVHHNVSACDMNEGKLECANVGENWLEQSHVSIL